jgi:WD40 repeat protein
MLTPKQQAELDRLLRALTPPDLAVLDLLALLQRGAIVTLEQDAGPEAVISLENAVTTSPVTHVRQLALTSLTRLANTGSDLAVNAIYRLAIDRGHPEAQAVISSGSLAPRNERDQVLYAFLYEPPARLLELDPALKNLTVSFLDEQQESVRERILARAADAGWESWAEVVSGLASGQPEPLVALISRFDGLAERERALLIDGLRRLAKAANPAAQSALAEICMASEDPRACAAVLENGYAPQDPTRRALFYFLTGQWDLYERLDFNHTLITAAFESASPAMRQRLLAHSRYTGQVGWISAGQGRRMRWLNELSEADWLSSVRQLTLERRWPELWQLAQSAPPVISAAILVDLSAAGFHPESEVEPAAWARLVELAQSALTGSLELKPARSLATNGPVTALAASPAGRLIAVGSAEASIQIWKHPTGPWQAPLSGPVAQTRAVDFSPKADTLVSAGSDHSLRVFRLADHQLVKTLPGHTALVRAVAVHPDNRTVFSASFDGSLRAWRYPNGPEMRQIAPGGELFGLALSDEGRVVLTGGTSGVVHVWKWPEAVEVRQLAGAAGGITSLAASLEGQLVAAAARDRMVRVWNHASGRLVQQIALPASPVTALWMHPGQELLVGGFYDGSILAWSLSTGQIAARFVHHAAAITGLAYLLEDGQMASSAGAEVVTWDLDVLLWLRQPGETARADAGQLVESKLRTDGLSDETRAWLAFTLELLRFRARFDIQLAEPHVISIGEYDIQLE